MAFMGIEIPDKYLDAELDTETREAFGRKIDEFQGIFFKLAGYKDPHRSSALFGL